jgi:hypothetical protein
MGASRRLVRAANLMNAMPSGLPDWLALLSPIPEHAVPQVQPVASADQIASGTAGPIAGWSSITINLSEPGVGLRHFMVMLDASGKILAAGDHVMVAHEVTRDGVELTISDHESIGGRYEDDGSFRGTRWRTHMEGPADSAEPGESQATPSAPTDDEIAALTRLVAEVMARHGKMA